MTFFLTIYPCTGDIYKGQNSDKKSRKDDIPDYMDMWWNNNEVTTPREYVYFKDGRYSRLLFSAKDPDNSASSWR